MEGVRPGRGRHVRQPGRLRQRRSQGSAPFGTAGKAACTDPHGINGSFSLDATNQWTCFYDVPPNPRHPPELQTACDTDAGQRVGENSTQGKKVPAPPRTSSGYAKSSNVATALAARTRPSRD